MQNFGMSMLWFWISYILVTLVGILHTIFNIYVLHMKPMDDKSMGEGYEKTKPWHPLYNIVLFTVFGFLYMNGIENPTIVEALITGAIWSGICIIFDVFGWIHKNNKHLTEDELTEENIQQEIDIAGRRWGMEIMKKFQKLKYFNRILLQHE